MPADSQQVELDRIAAFCDIALQDAFAHGDAPYDGAIFAEKLAGNGFAVVPIENTRAPSPEVERLREALVELIDSQDAHVGYEGSALHARGHRRVEAALDAGRAALGRTT